MGLHDLGAARKSGECTWGNWRYREQRTSNIKREEACEASKKEDAAEEAFKKKMTENEKVAEEKTLKRRLKRQKEKQKLKKKKKVPAGAQKKESSESEESSEEDEEEEVKVAEQKKVVAPTTIPLPPKDPPKKTMFAEGMESSEDLPDEPNESKLEASEDDDTEPPGEEEVVVLAGEPPAASEVVTEVIELENDSSHEEEEEVLEEEDDSDDIVVEREVRLDPSGQVIVSEGGERREVREELGEAAEELVIQSVQTARGDVADKDTLANTDTIDSEEEEEDTEVVNVDENPEVKDEKRRRSSSRRRSGRSRRSRSRRSRSRRRSSRMDDENLDFVVIDSTEDGTVPPGEEVEDEDILEVEVIKSNLALAEGRSGRSRSRSRSRRSSGSSRRRSRSSRRSRMPDDVNFRAAVKRRREEEERWEVEDRRRRREARRKEEEWRDASSAFLARLGVSEEGEGRDFARPPPALPGPALSPPALSRPPEWRPEERASSPRRSSWEEEEEEQYRAPVQRAGGQDLDLRFTEVLRPGNYLLCTWDSLSLGKGLQSSLYQIGAATAHGDSLLQCILPSQPGQVQEAVTHPTVPLLHLSGTTTVRHPGTSQFLPCVTESAALQQLLAFLERGRNRLRPAYTGVVLLSHFPESIPQLLKSLRRHGLYDSFHRTVAGLGAAVNFLADSHADRFRDGQSGQLEISLESAVEAVLGRREKSPMCEVRAAMCINVLDRLLDAPATHSNLFAKFSHPLASKKVAEWRDYRTMGERQEMFRPLQRHIAEELAAQQVDLLTSGIYAASESEEQLSRQEVVAAAMCRLLITAGFDFPGLLAQAASHLGELELSLRTSLLSRMAGQGRQVVDQTVRATRLVVAYFRRHGHRSLQELMRESAQLDALELQLVQEGAALATEEGRQRALDEFRPLGRFLEGREVEEGVAGATLRCLVEAGFSLGSLQRFYREEVAQGEAWACRCFRQYLRDRLRSLALHCGRLDTAELVAGLEAALQHLPLVVREDRRAPSGARGAPPWYCCALCSAVGGHWMVDCPTAGGQFGGTSPGALEETYLREELARADKAVKKRGPECGAVLASLQAVHRNLLARLAPDVVRTGGSREQAELVAEVAHRVLALPRLSHFSLKNEWDSGGEGAFLAMMGARLHPYEHLMPHGVGSKVLGGWVAKYFRESFPNSCRS